MRYSSLTGQRKYFEEREVGSRNEVGEGSKEGSGT